MVSFYVTLILTLTVFNYMFLFMYSFIIYCCHFFSYKPCAFQERLLGLDWCCKVQIKYHLTVKSDI